MGKVKPLIPSGKFCIQTRVNKKGETAIYLKYHLDGYLKRSTGINIPPTAWDDKKCCVKPSYPAASQINLQLLQFKTSIDKRLSEYDGEISRTVLSFILNGGDPTDAGWTWASWTLSVPAATSTASFWTAPSTLRLKPPATAKSSVLRFSRASVGLTRETGY